MTRLSRTRRTSTALAATLAIAAAGAPAAFARPALDGPPSGALSSEQQPPPRTVIQRVESGGFDVGDAAIGAAAGAGLILLTVGGISAGTHRRIRFTH